MPRPLSDASIQRRVLIAHDRAQALARNDEYYRDIAALQAAHDAAVAEAMKELRARTHVVSLDQLRPIHSRASTGRWPQLKAKKRGPPPGRVVEPLKGGRCPGFFDADGWEIPHSDNLERQAEKIRERAGLVGLVLPKRLRRLTPKKIAILRPVFKGVPGWEAVRVSKPVPGARKVTVDPVLSPDSATWYLNRPVPLLPLTQRHRTPHSDDWRIFDLHAMGHSVWKIITEVWPDAAASWSSGATTGKTSLEQRVTDAVRRAKRLIAAAYPAPPPPKRAPVEQRRARFGGRRSTP